MGQLMGLMRGGFSSVKGSVNLVHYFPLSDFPLLLLRAPSPPHVIVLFALIFMEI